MPILILLLIYAKSYNINNAWIKSPFYFFCFFLLSCGDFVYNLCWVEMIDLIINLYLFSLIFLKLKKRACSSHSIITL